MARPKKRPQFTELPDHFTPSILQQFLGKNRQAIYQLLRSGEIPSRKIGKTYLIVKNEFGKAWGFIQPEVPQDVNNVQNNIKMA
jgi:hypothetical protein